MSDYFPEMIIKTKHLEYLHICCLKELGCNLQFAIAIFKLQNVKMVLKMAVIFLLL